MASRSGQERPPRIRSSQKYLLCHRTESSGRFSFVDFSHTLSLIRSSSGHRFLFFAFFLLPFSASVPMKKNSRNSQLSFRHFFASNPKKMFACLLLALCTLYFTSKAFLSHTLSFPYPYPFSFQPIYLIHRSRSCLVLTLPSAGWHLNLLLYLIRRTYWVVVLFFPSVISGCFALSILSGVISIGSLEYRGF